MNDSEKNNLPSPLKMAAILAAAVFVIEYSIMLGIHLLALPRWLDELVDALLLILLLLPVIYWFMLRPMRKSVREAKQLYNEIREIYEQLEYAVNDWVATFDAIADGISIHSVNFEILKANKALSKMLGMPERELLGRKCYELFHKKNEPIPECPFEKSRISKQPESGEIFEPTLNKWLHVSTFPVFDSKGEMTKFVHVARDITERKKAEEALMASKKEWESTFDAISDPMFIHDKQHRLIRANRAYHQASGMPLSDMVGMPYYEVFPKMEGPFRMCLKALELQEEGVEEVFVPYLEKTFLVRCYPINDVHGRYLYSIHIMEDVTKRKKAEAEILERIDELERFRKATVQREFRIKELRDENEQLKLQVARFKKG